MCQAWEEMLQYFVNWHCLPGPCHQHGSSGYEGGTWHLGGCLAFLSAPPPRPQEAAREHSAVVALYRSHLLHAIQVSPPGFGHPPAALWPSVSVCTVAGRPGSPLSPHPRARWMKMYSGF